MSLLQTAILTAIRGSSGQQPYRVDALPVATGCDLATVTAAVEALRHASAVTTALITKGGETYLTVWPTGIAPRALPWRNQPVSSYTEADAARDAARPRTVDAPDSTTVAVQRIAQSRRVKGAAAARDRVRHINDSAAALTADPSEGDLNQEITMTRVTAPAAPRKPMPSMARKQAMPLRDQIMAGLQDANEDEPMSTDALRALCPAAASMDSMMMTLRRLEDLGVVASRRLLVGSRHRSHYWIPCSAGASPVVDLGEVDEVIAQAVADMEPYPEEVAPVCDAGGRSALRYLYDDVGALEIEHGGTVLVRLPAQELRKLSAFLARVAL